MNFTEYLKLNLPTPTTVVDIDDLNENSIKIDQELKKLKAELETAGSDEEIQVINKKIKELEEVGENLQILINNIKKDVDRNQASISDANDTGQVTTKHGRQVNASENSQSTGFKSQVNASRECIASGRLSQINASRGSTTTSNALNSQINASHNSTVNARRSIIAASSSSELSATNLDYYQAVMLASKDFKYTLDKGDDGRVVGGYDDELGWLLDSRNGEIYAKDEIKVGDKKLSTIAKSSTVVIANYDSHENSKSSADIVIEKGENAAKKINDAIQSLKGTGGEVKLMEGRYNLEYGIVVNVDKVHLTGIPNATMLIQNTNWKENPVNNSKHIIDTKSDNDNLHVTISHLYVKGAKVSDSRGFNCTGNSQVTNCTSENSGGNGFNCRDNSQITNCASENSVSNGFFCGDNSKVTNCISINSGSSGFSCRDNSQITNCASENSDSNGFFCGDNSQTTNCASENSGRDGLYCSTSFKGVCSFNVLKGDKLNDSSSSPAKVSYNIIQEVQ